MRDISFVVPALNEERNIEGTVEQIVQAATGRFARFEIVLVDDGSTDETGRVMDALAGRDDRVRVIHHGRNRGLGAAYKSGAAAARCEYVMLVPGDNAHPAEGLYPILDAVGKADIVIPFVLNKEIRSWFRRLVSWLFVNIVNTMFGLSVHYYNGLVVHRKALMDTITITTDSFAYQAEALVKLLTRGCSYIEVGAIISERETGVSQAIRWKQFVTVGQTLIHLFIAVRLARPAEERSTST